MEDDPFLEGGLLGEATAIGDDMSGMDPVPIRDFPSPTTGPADLTPNENAPGTPTPSGVDPDDQHNGGEDPDNNVSDNNQEKKTDCAGVVNGKAYYDNCQVCVGGTTGLKPCDPYDQCMDSLLNTGAYDGMSCIPRKSIQELQAAFPCATNLEDLQREYEEGFRAGIQCMFGWGAGDADVQGATEYRCVPLSIQYIGCADQITVMDDYTSFELGKNISPCDYTNGSFVFPGVAGDGIDRIVNNYTNAELIMSGKFTNTASQIQLHTYILEPNTQYLIVAKHAAGAHAFVIDDKGLDIHHVKGYDPNVGKVSSLNTGYYFANGNTVYVYKINDCK